MVSYPHSKLNREYVQYKDFDQLPLHIFEAGEIETILRTQGEGEKTARLRILLTCMYHAQFLDIGEIRDQYDVLMKGVERGELHWVDNLSDRLDRALDRRARVIDKERVSHFNSKQGSGGNQKNKMVKKGEGENRPREIGEFIYCMAFNKGECTETGSSHPGRFGGKENVTKHHVCKKCFVERGLKVGHPEFDDRCPFKRT